MRLEDLTPPTATDMRDASGISKSAARNWAAYCRSARTKFRIVNRLVKAHLPAGQRIDDILDWGCAAGGVAVLMDHRHPDSRVTAADVDARALEWLQKQCPSLTCQTLEPGIRLPFEDASFDVIYGISVLTHIPPDLQPFYVAELGRVAREGALVLLTVLGERACRLNQDGKRNAELHPRDVAQLRDAGILYASYRDNVLDSMAFSRDGQSDYGVTYHSDAYAAELFGPHFDILAIDQESLSKQDVIIARPRGRPGS